MRVPDRPATGSVNWQQETGMTVSLTPELEAYIQEKIASGNYTSPQEVIWHALRLLREEDAARQMRFEELKREIQIGIDAADRGELVDGEQFMAELKQRYGEGLKQTG
jgi:antitoxin ParD1/3/4